MRPSAPAAPLIAHADPAAPLAWRAGELIAAGRFLADAHALAERLPPAGQITNLCADRYCFAVGLAAALLRQADTLLPPTQAPEGLRALLAAGPCLIDAGGSASSALVQAPAGTLIRVEEFLRADAPLHWPAPAIALSQPLVTLHTSGSTGQPVAHRKDFGTLLGCVRAEAARVGAVSAGGCAILATVPAQHSYGLESSVLLPLFAGGILCAPRPLFPADIAAALAQLPRPRLLCTTPVHLRALLESGTALPELDALLCATAPLERALAQRAETCFGAPLIEIYGATETGQMASRRTVREAAWWLWPGVQLSLEQGGCVVHGGHLPAPRAVADVLEPLDAEHFLLQGRQADLVNVAGKRSSLAYLTHQLLGIPGVVDGAFFLPEHSEAAQPAVARVAAVAVAPQLSAAQLLSRLRERIDAVFLPRPLLLVARLPRNDAGKLPQQALRALLVELATSSP